MEDYKINKNIMDNPININPPRRMQNAVIVALAILSIFLIAKTIGEFKKNSIIGDEFPATNTITVSGKGEVSAPADVATIYFGVEEKGKTVPEAQGKATEKGNKAIKYLRDNGIEEKDIKTTGYNVNPEYSYSTGICTAYNCPPSNQTLVGYQVSQSVTVKIRDLDKAGAILGGIGATGVSNISGLSFTIDDEDGLKAEARKKAIDDAREKAKALAKDLGVSLGKISSFSENSNYPYYADTAVMNKSEVGMGGAEAISPDLPRGENEITSNVTITYKIK